MTPEEETVLEKKFEDVVREYLQHMYGGTMTGYILVAHSMTFNDKGEAFSMYPLEVPRDQPRHISTGLFELGREQLDQSSWINCDEDEDDE